MLEDLAGQPVYTLDEQITNLKKQLSSNNRQINKQATEIAALKKKIELMKPYYRNR